METNAPSYRCHRYPAEIIAQCVRLSYRFPLSYRDIEELMFERGIIVSYESIRRWCHKFGRFFAAEIRRQRRQPTDKWHLNEVFIKGTVTLSSIGTYVREIIPTWEPDLRVLRLIGGGIEPK